MFPKSSQKFVAVVLFGVLCAGIGNIAQAYTIMGDVNSYEKDGNNITFNCENGRVKLSFLADDLVRVHMAPSGRDFPRDTLHLDENGPYAVIDYDWPGASFQVNEAFDADLEGVVYNIQAGKLLVKVRKQPFKLAFYDARGSLLVMEKEGIVNAGLGYEGSKVYETMALPDDEHFFGFGAHNHPLDMRRQQMTCYARELETTKWIGGFPVPWFMSTRGYGVFFNNLDDDVTLKMGTTPGEYSFEGTSGCMEGWDMDYYLMYGPTLADILVRYIDIVGRPPLPDKWFFGHIQCKCCDWGQKDVLEVARKYREGDWPCDVIIIDYQGMDAGFKWSSLFPDVAHMYETLGKMGFKTGLSTALFHPLFDWKKYDPTVAGICQQYWALHVPRLKDGNAFWWQDNSERSQMYTGMEKFANGYETHELFGSLWAKNVFDGMAKMGLYGRPVISRGGPIGGHRYIIPFAGDLPHGLEFIRTDLNWLRNGGLSLYPFCLVELGGFIDRGRPGMNPLDEYNVIRRMINLVPVVPISRSHGTGEFGAMLPWQLTKQQQDLYRYYLKLRYRLHPYLYTGAIEAVLSGRPALAPLVFDYQDDKNTYDKDFEFMLGRLILVAPVLEKVNEWSVYLPKGKWIHYWTGKEYDGGQTVTVSAPLYGKDGLPMFVKSGAIIPMMPEMSYIYEKKADPISLDVYPDAGAPSTYVMYDCEKVGGGIWKTRFVCSEDAAIIKVAISVSDLAYELWVHCGKEPAAVIVDSKGSPQLRTRSDYEAAKEGWYYGPGCFYGSDSVKTLNIKVPKGPNPHFIRIPK
ncbi:MAG TPA: TIM-barrel domain-containing protein [Sedimentisphaerales bacterium]|nr:TIM-barrel domain-containing protein [Sedimentisphaerales bacterium]